MKEFSLALCSFFVCFILLYTNYNDLDLWLIPLITISWFSAFVIVQNFIPLLKTIDRDIRKNK